jgi:hypothetical protein
VRSTVVVPAASGERGQSALGGILEVQVLACDREMRFADAQFDRCKAPVREDVPVDLLRAENIL